MFLIIIPVFLNSWNHAPYLAPCTIFFSRQQWMHECRSVYHWHRPAWRKCPLPVAVGEAATEPEFTSRTSMNGAASWSTSKKWQWPFIPSKRSTSFTPPGQWPQIPTPSSWPHCGPKTPPIITETEAEGGGRPTTKPARRFVKVKKVHRHPRLPHRVLLRSRKNQKILLNLRHCRPNLPRIFSNANFEASLIAIIWTPMAPRSKDPLLNRLSVANITNTLVIISKCLAEAILWPLNL